MSVNKKHFEAIAGEIYKKYSGVIEVLTRMDMVLSNLYGENVRLPEDLVNELIKEIINLELKENKQ